MQPQHVDRFSQTDLQSLAIYERDGLTMNTALFDKALPGKPALVDAIVTAFQMPGAHRRANCCIWLRCGPKVHMFQLYNGYKLDVNGSSASVAAAWNWIPAPTSVVVGTTCLQTPVLQDGFVELLPHLVETSGMTEADPLMIEPRSLLYQLWCKLTAPVNIWLQSREHNLPAEHRTVESYQHFRHCTYECIYNDANVWFHLCLRYAYMLAGQRV